jgi:hypothetical protein
LILTTAERDAIASHIDECLALRGPTPANDAQTEAEMLLIVTKLMLALPSQTANLAAAEARGEAFLASLDDLPTWTVAAAARRWYRGEAGEQYNYHWCPGPAELRKIASGEMWRISDRVHYLRRLLQAEPLIEYSDKHCAEMRVRLAGLFQFKSINPAGRERRQQQDAPT